MGTTKEGRCGGYLGAHITKSAVVVYRIDYAARQTDRPVMGYRKTTYGRDGGGGDPSLD